MSTTPRSALEIGEQYLADHPELEMLELIMPDINGIARGKWAKPESIKKAFKNQLRFPVSAYAGDIWGEGAAGSGLVLATGDQDGIARGKLTKTHYLVYPPGCANYAGLKR